MAFTRYGEEFRRQRCLMSRGLARGRIPQYHPLITASTRPLLRSLLASSGGDFVPAIRRYAGGLNLSVVYGLEATRDDDPALVKVEGATDLLANEITAGGGLWAVDIFPFRLCLVIAASTHASANRTYTLVKYLPAWFPGAGFLNKAAAWKETIVDSVDFPFSLLKARMVLLRDLRTYMQLSNEAFAECWHSASFLLFHSVTGIRPRESSRWCPGI